MRSTKLQGANWVLNETVSLGLNASDVVLIPSNTIKMLLYAPTVEYYMGLHPAIVDVVFYDGFLDETTLLRLYAATNVMVLPYLNMQQISSGILADTLGSGRVAITTKFMYARELIHSNKELPEGMYVGRYVRGILVDPGEPSVEQIAKALDYLVFNEGKRLMMEKQAHQRGYQMRWNNSAWALLQYIDFVRDLKEIVTGRGVKFTRDRSAPFELSQRESI